MLPGFAVEEEPNSPNLLLRQPAFCADHLASVLRRSVMERGIEAECPIVHLKWPKLVI